MIRFLHTGDIHASKARADEMVRLFDFFVSEVKTRQIDAVLICGDFWDSAVVNNAEFAKVILSVSNLVKVVPVYMIYGTPSHDIGASLEIFAQMGANVAIKPQIWRFEKSGDKSEAVDLLAVPEPRRSEFVAKTASETDKKIRNHLVKTFESFAKRKNAKPALVMFHGEISGVSMQNGVCLDSATQLTKDVYSLVSPLYVAAAHIHKPQNIDKVVRYCGAPVPCNFGETHKPTYTLVEVENGKANFSEVALPFCQNVVFECDESGLSELFGRDLAGFNVKVKLSLSAVKRKTFQLQKESFKLKEATKAENLQIQILPLKENLVRLKDLSKVFSMSEKLKIYAKENGFKLTNGMLEKSATLESELLTSERYPTHEFELVSMSLRGAKGLRGGGKEEIFIDFTKFEDGVLGVLGKNGTGKSTLIENMHPFTCLLSRNKALLNHFYLKDSHRIVTFRDENGRLYKFTMQLTAHRETGVGRYFAETSDDGGASWQAVKACDGNKDSYDAYVKETFGELSMYLRTAFFTTEKNKEHKDLADLSKNEKIQFMSELLGSERIGDMHEAVKERLKFLDKEISKFENAESEVAKLEVNLTTCVVEKNELKKRFESVKSEIFSVEKELESARKSEREFSAKFAKYDEKYGERDVGRIKKACEKRVADVKKQLKILHEKREKNEFFLKYKSEVEKYQTNLEKKERLNDERVVVLENLEKLNFELSKIEKERGNAKSKYEKLLSDAEKMSVKIQNLEEKIFESSQKCPTCGAKLSEEKQNEFAANNEKLKKEAETLKKSQKKLEKDAENERVKFVNFENELKKAEEKEEPLREKREILESELIETDEYLEKNSQYKTYLGYIFDESIAESVEKFEAELKNEEDVLEELAGLKSDDYATLLKKIEKLEKTKKENEKQKLEGVAAMAKLGEREETLKKQLKTEKEKFKTWQELKREKEEFEVLKSAFSENGIQALELEVALPRIVELTNEILKESYGDKFEIRISTEKDKGKKGVVSDFSIDVFNTESGFETPLNMLSKGEKVWVSQALQFAFSIVRAERTNFCFKVRFVDESDGGLDAEGKLKYLKMIDSAHKNGKARLTVLITHSQELKEVLGQIYGL